MKPTSEILKRMTKNSSDHPNGVYTRLYRYLLRQDIYFKAYKNLYRNSGAATKGINADTADDFIIGVCGSRSDCEKIKEFIKVYLRDKLGAVGKLKLDNGSSE